MHSANNEATTQRPAAGDALDTTAVVAAFQALVNADTWARSQQVLLAYPDLLSPDADALLAPLVWAQSDPDIAALLTTHLELLRRAREIGVEQAIAERIDAEHPVPRIFRDRIGDAIRAEQDFQQTGSSTALDQACALLEEVLRDPAFDPSTPNFGLWALSKGGELHLRRYWISGGGDDLDRTVELWERAVRESRPGSPEQPRMFGDLSLALRNQFLRAPDPNVLARALDACAQAIALSAADSPLIATYVDTLVGLLTDANDYGATLREEYLRGGDAVRLELAIQVLTLAAVTPTELHQRVPRIIAPLAKLPALPSTTGNLGLALHDRFLRTADPHDLDVAIQALEQAVRFTPRENPQRPIFLNNLGTALRSRFARDDDQADLKRLVACYREALRLTPQGSLRRAGWLHNLGTGLQDRYRQSGRLADLKRALETLQAAVSETPPDSPDLPRRLNSLATTFYLRYLRRERLVDADAAIELLTQALDLTPRTSPERPGWLENLGDVLLMREALSERVEDLDRAIEALEESRRLRERTFSSAPVAYQLGQQHQRADLYTQLVATHLRRAALRPRRAPADRLQALRAAEAGKSRLLSATLGWAEVQAPATIAAQDLARERDLLAEVGSITGEDLAGYGVAPVTDQTVAPGRSSVDRFRLSGLLRLQNRRQNLEELERLWNTMARSGPEAREYVALRRGEDLSQRDVMRLLDHLGPDGAVVSLFTTSRKTLLFVMRPGQRAPSVMEGGPDPAGWRDLYRRLLRELYGYDGTDRRGETWDRALRGLLADAAPLLGGARHVALAPERLGHAVPWAVVAERAGWRTADGQSLALQTVPGLGVLLRLLDRPPADTSGPPLVVGDPGGDLPRSRREAHAVADLLGTQPLIGGRATRRVVLERLSNAGVVHVASHAELNPGSQLDSHIVLADGVLSVRELLKMRLRADLVVLSACRTGFTGVLAGDELVGLGQAFLQAGARSLAVTLWEVDDPATDVLMTTFHRSRLDGMASAEALSQATAAVRAWPQWQHPYYWGAFVLIGA